MTNHRLRVTGTQPLQRQTAAFRAFAYLHRFRRLLHFLCRWFLAHTTGASALRSWGLNRIGSLASHWGTPLALAGLGRGKRSCKHEGAGSSNKYFLHCELQRLFCFRIYPMRCSDCCSVWAGPNMIDQFASCGRGRRSSPLAAALSCFSGTVEACRSRNRHETESIR